MKVIFINWTKPFFERKKIEGYRKLTIFNYEGDEYFLPEYEILMQKCAILSAKMNTKFPIKLITDKVGFEYYSKIGLIDLFDEIDTDFLEDINNKYDISPSQFWTSGKIISICNEKPPFLFLDLDLILKEPLPEWIFNYDVVHTHWEIPRSYLYVEERIVKEYNLNIPSFDAQMLIPNTSFLFVNNQSILNEYLSLHIEIVTKKYNHVPEWLWLMSDQNILGYTLRKFDSKVTTFRSKVYVQFPDNSNSDVGHLTSWVDIPQKYMEPDVKFEHVWLDKRIMVNDEPYRNLKTKEWSSIIDSYYNPPTIKLI